MWERLSSWLVPDRFMPHGHCYRWEPGIVAGEVGTNVLIGLSYLFISLTLIRLIRRIEGLPFTWVYACFGAFIVTCGFTHFLDVAVIWAPAYEVDVLVRGMCAVASVGTAVLLVPFVPTVVAFAEQVAADRAERDRLLASTRSVADDVLAALGEDGVLALDADDRIAHANARVGELAGRSTASLVGQRFLDAFPQHRDSALGASLRETARTRTSMTTELRQPSGTWLEVRTYPRGGGGVVLHARDITDRKAAAEERERLMAEREGSLREAREALQMREAFLSMAAHELRTPVAGVALTAETLVRRAEKKGLPEESAWVLERARAIKAQSDRLTTLVSDMLDVSRLMGGHMPVTAERVELADLVDRAVIASATKPGDRALVAVEGHAAAYADPVRVEQIVVNLLSNALKYGEARAVEVRIETVEHGGGAARVRVRDHGIGIAPEDRERIFEPFVRAVSERHYGGFGLGLWISRRLAEAQGGTLTVDASPDGGTEFTLTLPLPREGA